MRIILDEQEARLKAKGIPIYGQITNDQLVEQYGPGLYIGLFHGYPFHNNVERANGKDWGSQGPVIGPLRYYHTTYGRPRFEFVDEGDEARYNPEVEFEDEAGAWGLKFSKDKGLVIYDGVGYGDWTLFAAYKGKGDLE